jgi:membrane associated rhomboid family serine protease
MFPIRDHNPSGRTPYVTRALVAINIVIFLGTLPLQDSPVALFALFDAWGVVPYRITAGTDWHTIATSMFLHAGWLHLAGNMLFLWIFGDNMEDAFGHLGFLAFYLAGGVAAAALQIAAEPGSPVPMVGASGAIAAVLGGYLLLFPRARIDVLIIFIVFFRILPVPAWMMLGLWFAFQILNGLGSDPSEGGVAHWAHAGGFAAGVVLAVPAWLRRGGPAFWRRTQGTPPHPQAEAPPSRAAIPIIRRRR